MLHKALFQRAMLVLLCCGLSSILAQENLLDNGNLEKGDDTAWNGWSTNRTVVTDDPAEGDYCILFEPIFFGKPHNAGVLLREDGTFAKGKVYTWSMFMKTEPGVTRLVHMKPELFVSPFTAYGEQTFEITDEWAEYHVTTPRFEEDVTPATLVLQMGHSGEGVWLDVAKFYKGAYIPTVINFIPNAKMPIPEDGDPDVSPMTDLSWVADVNAVYHDVYFGENYEDVNDASRNNGVYVDRVVSTSLNPGDLDLGTTYHWRVDEVFADNTLQKGDVWSFTVEPVSYSLANVRVAASSFTADSQMAVNTVNGSGLDSKGRHSKNLNQMWLSEKGDLEASIAFTWDKVYKLDQMQVWNHNSQAEFILGYGIKEALIEITSDGTTWIEWKTVELPKAPGEATYTGDLIDLEGLLAKGIRITAKSNWSEIGTNQVGLSEVNFYYIPTYPRKPQPESGVTVHDPDVVLKWRPGRGAVSHEVYWGQNQNLDLISTGDTPELDISQDIELGQTYQWKVVEVDGDANLWESGIWDFTAQDYILIDDMESYRNIASLAIWATWLDGSEFGTDDPDNGSLVGADPMFDDWSPATGLGRDQSLPIWFNNTTASKSEALRIFETPLDWTQHGIKSLSLYILEGADNLGNGQIYAKINNVKINYQRKPGTQGDWNHWVIDLTSVNTNLANVTSLAFGIAGGKGAGVLYMDDIRLYAINNPVTE